MTPQQKTRRQFVKATALAAVTGSLAAGHSLSAAATPSKTITRKTIKTDVLVCGGGCAGIAAALASARNGAKTLLIERAGFSGGIITTVGLPYFDGLIDKPTGRLVVKGIALELLEKLGVAKPGAKQIDDLRADLITKYWGSVYIPNVEEFKLLTDDLILKHSDHLSVLYHSTACEVEVKDGRIAAVTIANKDGLTRVEARQVIDCTGDGDIAHWAGAPTEKMNPLMPLTMHFRIGNVVPGKEMQAAAKQALVDAHQRGDLPEFYGPGIMFAFAKDEVYVHATRIAADATDAADFTRADLEKNNRYDDAIATGCWFLDVHPQKTTTDKPFAGSGFQPKPYDISYRTLVPKTLSNLLVAGRCHSASKEAAASSRVTATAMALGQAAGTAAALSIKSKTEVGSFSGTKVREALTQQGGGPFTDA